MPTRRASAVWEGGLKSGKGSFTGESGKIAGTNSFGARFGDAGGTNPEELLASAEAACYSMALGAALEQKGTPADRIETKAAATIEKVGDGFRITSMHLNVRAKVPKIDPATFQQLADATKDGCPVSAALKGNLKIELDAKLV